MVVVAQLVEPWIVIPVVVGSSPIDHPKTYKELEQSNSFLFHSVCHKHFSLHFATPFLSNQPLLGAYKTFNYLF